ncbi:MaoC family dehydratase [Pseudomonas sp. BGr12]|uniref:MaoC family dehydratase n=1 Tax=Pseudomonas sp. BGr12 TaxID=2936269 RepID=UPI00255A1214|nr:MaoC family dehydratase [Pseudomonas sp. BJa5]MDL2428471.1 MaoC family dehydratase [Pseudomonas sp. BJa5]
MNFVGKAFNEISAGDSFGQTITVTETHIVQACGMFGDYNPLHSDERFCEGSRFGRRILHGPMTGALMSASVGMYFYGTAVAYLEQSCSFVSPVFAGNTLTTTWVIKELLEKAKINGGIAVLEGTCRNEEGDMVARALGKIMLSNR